MRTGLDHLPEKQQGELERIRQILLAEFDVARNAGGGGTQSWRKNGKVLKIVLFGSYARNDWVDEPQNGYLSDFDLLVIVSHPNLTDIADYWYVAEDKILHDPQIGRTVNIIVHTLDEVNRGLAKGEYFWTDIIRDGVAVLELPGHPFSVPRPMTSSDAADIAGTYFSAKFGDIDVWIDEAAKHIENSSDLRARRHAAFRLHQAVEAAYICFLLVHTFYFPRSHNIKFLRSLAEDADTSLIDAWPRELREDRRRFEALKRAYVEARYSDQFDLTAEDLRALASAASRLQQLVEASCARRVQALKLAAGSETH